MKELPLDDPAAEDPLDPAALLKVAPGLARIAAGVALRTAEWTVSTTARAGARVARAAVSGESPGTLLTDLGSDARHQAQYLLGLAGLEEHARRAMPDVIGPRRERSTENGASGVESAASLRERGAELLRRSADVRYEEAAHPAYPRILDELAPDEARILRLLVQRGPQPAVDVRSSWPLGVNSQLIAPGLTMIGAEAGCRFVERVPAYLNNLFRLGLIWFSREPVADSLRYHVLEAQPDVIAATKQAGRAKTVRRSIHLTPFGYDFCHICLPVEGAVTAAPALVLPTASADDGPASVVLE